MEQVLIAVLDFAVVWIIPLSVVGLYLSAAEYFLVKRPRAKGTVDFRAVTLRRLIFYFIGLIGLLHAIPFDEQLRSQIISLVGLLTTGLIVYIVAEPLKRIVVPAEFLSSDTTSTTSNSEPKLDFDGKVFLSYRREDSQAEVDRLCDKLFARIGRDKIFRDIDSISLGQDFRGVVSQTLDNCSFGIVVIGQKWLGKHSDGTSRIHQDADLVRMEVRQMLQRDIPVIPLLIDNMNVPSTADLPEDLHDLIYRNAARLRPDPDFETDVDRLIRGLVQASQLNAEAEAKR